MKILCDYSRCTGCLACVTTCLDHHHKKDEADAVSPRAIKKTVLPSGCTQYVTEIRKAFKDEKGTLVYCDGCLACMNICPNGAIYTE